MAHKLQTRNSRIWPARKAVAYHAIKDVLRIESVDLCFQENGKRFHTDLYELMAKPRAIKRPRQLVVRRGAPFTVRLLCDRRFDPSVDTMVLLFSVLPFGKDNICFGNGTEVYVLLQTGQDTEPAENDWGAILSGAMEKPSGDVELVLTITTPSYAPLARWKLEFHCRLDTTDAKSFMKSPGLVYVLYNPWCKDDIVYLEDDAARSEYVLNDSTMIWKTAPAVVRKAWYLGQFEKHVLDCALFILAEVAHVPAGSSGNPVLVSRALAGAMNTRVALGVLVGNWSGDYETGRPPTSWSGSVKILQQFYHTRAPVKFGQCWVYGGLLGTVLRTIGIPSRLITAFQSGCDIDGSLTVDYFLSEGDTLDNGMAEEGVWNYHVFNEIWMKRHDLRTERYDGWQVLDGTPQRLSDGLFRAGPCPVKAIKQGDVHIPYDAASIYAEVNADIVYWSLGNAQNPPTPLDVLTQHVGQNLSTKAIGSNARVDVTDRYKHPEGSNEERQVMLAAMKASCQRFSNAGLGSKLLCGLHAGIDINPGSPSIKLQLLSDRDLVYGATLRIELLITSLVVTLPVEVVGSLVLKNSDYTGRRTETIKKQPIFVRLEPEASKSVVVLLDFQDYYRPNTDHATIKASCVVEVKGSERLYYTMENFHLNSAPIAMTLVENSVVGRLAVKIQFTNPLPIPLTNGWFIVEGSRYTDPMEKEYELIPVGEMVEFFYPINLSQRGRMVISAGFVSNELKNVDGYLERTMASTAKPKNFKIWPVRKVSDNHSIKDVLRVESVDLCFEENGNAFHTQSYEMMMKPRPTKRPRQLVVRRGAPFLVRLLTNRRFEPTVDTMVLVFSIVPSSTDAACFGNGTETYVIVHGGDDHQGQPVDDWGAVLSGSKDKPKGKVELTLSITTPSYAPIVKWNLEFHCRLDTTDAKTDFELKDPMYLLFNPWCKEDAVYMEEEARRTEYVLEDSTMICKPGAQGFRMNSWFLGQYEANVLDCVLYIISEVGRVKAASSGNPVLVTRALTGALNSAGGYGVLQGNWSGDYQGGTPPTSWSGSVKILQEFFETTATVKFGQCWVFGGLFASVCRSIGIPCRIITNFESASDHDSSLSIDYFLDSTETVSSELTSDSVWNYHVWNEAWMRRKDLQNPDFDGWQVIDSTPQQLSDGMFKCGPCPVGAVRRGFVHVPYDGEFIYAEVNADVIYWSIGSERNLPKPLQIKTNQVGRDMSTKEVGSDQREDITAHYKFPEGSKEERDVMKTAIKFSSQRFSSSGLAKRLLGTMVDETTANDDLIKLELKSDEEMVLGKTFQIELIVANSSPDSEVEVTGSLVLKDSDYTGRLTETLKTLPLTMKLGAQESKSMMVSLDYKEYSGTASNKTNMKAVCMVDVKGCDRTFFTMKNFHLSPPTIEMTVIEHSVAGPLAVQVELRNPLPVPLTGGRFLVEGSRFTDPIEKQYDLIPVDGTVQFVYPINLSYKGKMVISGSFISNELKNKLHSPSAEVLTVKSVDLCIEENGKDHHTKRYESMARDEFSGKIPKLVVRRGQPFRLRLICDRPYDRSRDALSLIFTVADEEQPTHGHATLVGIPVNQFPEQLGDAQEWGAAIETIRGDMLGILVKPAATAPVGQWKLDIDTKLLSDAFGKSYSLPQAFYVLFNPWCPDDLVYMEEKAHRHEYVMSDTTLIYRGSYNRLRPSVWKFGQFEKHILDCSLLLIAKIGKVSATHRGDPVRVCRAISAAVNSPDDDGALLGNWSGDFSGGTPPTKWVGSVEILQQFYKKQKPVKFAQCWVFAGVVSTIARAVGIPSRVVTNYSSAHDTQASLTVDYFVDKSGKIMEEMNADSIWNYHVWNEVWMQRPDLGISSDGDYGGWQAIDATPQETSDGMFRCGPASVLAVKLGEVLKPYDNNFLFAEVNADKVFWRYTGPHHPLKLLRKDVLGIGLFISTKAVGRWEREDITASYKFAEKSVEERATMLKALKQANSYFSRYYLNEEFNEVYFNFELRDDIKIGEPFSVILLVKNRSSESRHIVEGSLHVDTVLYTGKDRDSVKVDTFSVTLEPGTEESVRMVVEFQEYYRKLRDQAAFNISCMATVQDTEFEFYAQDDFRVRKPDIKISLLGKPVSQAPVEVQFTLENPLPIALRKGVFHVEGSGIGKPLLFKHPEIAPGEKVLNTFTMTPPYSGRLTLAAKFTSKELDDVDGFLAFIAHPRPEDIIMEVEDNAIVARTDVVD
uniref:protein-glutamine gamma-glutamyltransferase n=1 Tax=Anopheles dirus TaxID=7168 RepID=A0A182NEW6_9DIPT